MRDEAKEGHRIEGLKPEVDDFSSLVVGASCAAAG